MTTLSLAMIVRDEERMIGRVLESARSFVDEIIVVDTGSTDGTVRLAAALGAQVHHFPWVDDFAAARNASFEHASGDWILWLDADDVIEDPERFLDLKSTLGPHLDAVLLPYRDGCHACFRPRLVRRDNPGLTWAGPVHEHLLGLDPARTTTVADLAVFHRPPAREGHGERNLRILQRMVESGDCSGRIRFHLVMELVALGRHQEAVSAWEGSSDPPSNDEKYQLLWLVARSLRALGHEERSLQTLGRAVVLDSRRAEAFVALGVHFYKQGDWERAVPFFCAADALSLPTGAGIYDSSAYTWQPPDFLSVCYQKLGRLGLAMDCARRALELGTADPERVRANLRFLVDRLQSPGQSV